MQFLSTDWTQTALLGKEKAGIEQLLHARLARLFTPYLLGIGYVFPSPVIQKVSKVRKRVSDGSDLLTQPHPATETDW